MEEWVAIALGLITVAMLLAISIPAAACVATAAALAFAWWTATNQQESDSKKELEQVSDDSQRLPPSDVNRPQSPTSMSAMAVPSEPSELASKGPLIEAAWDVFERGNELYEHHLDAKLSQYQARYTEPNTSHFHGAGRAAIEKALQSELPLRDPNLVPLNGQPGCPRDLGRL